MNENGRGLLFNQVALSEELRPQAVLSLACVAGGSNFTTSACQSLDSLCGGVFRRYCLAVEVVGQTPGVSLPDR